MIKLRKRIFFVRNTLILFIFVYSLVILFKNDFDRYNVEVEFLEYQAKLDEMNSKIQSINDELKLSNTKEYLEVLVRERLGYVFDGEKSIINIIDN